MKFKQLIIFAIKDINRNRKKFLFTFFGIVLGIIVILFFISFAIGINKTIINNILESVPLYELRISQSSYKLPFLSAIKFNSRKIINQNTFDNVRNIKGVKNVYPQLNITFPVSIDINLFGYSFRSDLTISGLPQKLLKTDNIEVKKDFKFDENARYLPCLVSYQILDMYNSNFAVSNNLPKLTKESLVGRNFTLLFGTSSLTPGNRILKKRCEIIGFSNRSSTLGLTLPLEAVEYYNKWFYGNKYKKKYSGLIVHADKVSNVQPIQKAIEKLGYDVISHKDEVAKISLTVYSIGGIFILLGSIVILISFINIYNLFSFLVISQKDEINILRCLGASKKDIINIFFIEAAIIKVLSIISGIILSLLLIRIGDSVLLRYVPNLTFKPATFFYTPVYIYLIVSAAIFLPGILSVFVAFKNSTRSGIL